MTSEIPVIRRSERQVEEIHLGHVNHLCNLVALGVEVDTYKPLVQNPKFLCKKCGRAAVSESNLCEPINL